jgi:hypothetical protein
LNSGPANSPLLQATEPVIRALEDSRNQLIEADKTDSGAMAAPPIAFEIARRAADLVNNVGQVYADPDDFS